TQPTCCRAAPSPASGTSRKSYPETLAAPGQRQLGGQVDSKVVTAGPAHRVGAGIELGPVGKLATFGQRRVRDFQKNRRHFERGPVAGARAADVPQGDELLAVIDASHSHGR